MEKLAAAECSMPWSTGRIERYPVPPRRPWLNTVPRLRSTVGLRSLSVKTRLEVVGSREGEVLRREGLGRVAEEGVRVVAEERVEIGARVLVLMTSSYRRVRTGSRAGAADRRAARVARPTRPWTARHVHRRVPHAPDASRAEHGPYAGRRRIASEATSRASGGHERSRVQAGQAAAPAPVGTPGRRGRRGGRRRARAHATASSPPAHSGSAGGPSTARVRVRLRSGGRRPRASFSLKSSTPAAGRAERARRTPRSR